MSKRRSLVYFGSNLMTRSPSEKRRRSIPSLHLDDPPAREDTTTRHSSKAAVVSAGPSNPFLIVIRGGHAGEMHALRQPESILGRGRSSTICLEDDGVSRRHARVLCERSDAYIEDLGSVNGTFVNGQLLQARCHLADGDKIALGPVAMLKFTFTDELEEDFQRRMFEAALRDPLTHAYNRRYFAERLDKELAFARRHGTPLSVIMLDIDHFKRINDTAGHSAGDAVLVKLAQVALDTLRSEDVLTRVGGEEFAVICRDTDLGQAAIVAERLRELVAAMRVGHEGKTITLTASLGVAASPDVETEDPMQLVSAADEAMYEAKAAGRNRVVVKRGRSSKGRQ